MKSRHKFLLVFVTAVSVISDSMLIPFYPQYFAKVFGVDDPQYVGFYLAIYCLVVMLAFPIWAKIAKRVAILPLLVISQSLAAVASMACFWSSDLSSFWLASLLMMLCKASYLLVYPFILSRESALKHGSTIGLLAVVVEFGAILGALLGGAVLQWFDPRQAFLIMALGDLLQVTVCLWLIAQGLDSNDPHESDVQPVDRTSRYALFKLAVVRLLFFFSAFLGYHFFTRYWTELTGTGQALQSAAVFAIPAAMALLGLAFNHYRGKVLRISTLYFTMALASLGALLQAAPYPSLVLAGRILFGWALFQSFVRFDLLLFQLSQPKRYTEDYSLMRIAQSSGVLLAAYAAGWIINHWAPAWMFISSAIGLCLALGCFLLLFGTGASRYKLSASSA